MQEDGGLRGDRRPCKSEHASSVRRHMQDRYVAPLPCPVFSLLIGPSCHGLLPSFLLPPLIHLLYIYICTLTNLHACLRPISFEGQPPIPSKQEETQSHTSLDRPGLHYSEEVHRSRVLGKGSRMIGYEMGSSPISSVQDWSL